MTGEEQRMQTDDKQMSIVYTLFKVLHIDI